MDDAAALALGTRGRTLFEDTRVISLLLSTLRVSARWSLWWLRSRTTLWLISLARYNLLSLLRAR